MVRLTLRKAVLESKNATVRVHDHIVVCAVIISVCDTQACSSDVDL